MIASTLLLMPGRSHVALDAVREALARAPRDVACNKTWIAVIESMSRDAKDAQIPAFLDALHKAVRTAPACAVDALPVEIGLLIRSDKAEAERRLRAVMETNPLPDAVALMTIAGLAEASASASRTELLDLVERVYGVTPRFALGKAALAAKTGGDDAGVREFDALRKRGVADASDPDWDTARAMFLEALGRADAGPAWIALADAREREIVPQIRVIASTTRRADRDAVSRVIDRIRALTGDEGANWRVARADWLLGAPHATDQQVSEAAALLGDVVMVAPDNVGARRLLAAALERLGNLAGATEQLRKAAELSPTDTSTLLENARLAQSQGRPEVAGRVLDLVLASPGMAAQSAEQAACLLASRGDVHKAVALLEPYVGGARADRSATLLLVRLHLVAGEPAKAVPYVEKLMETPDTELVDVAACVYESLGKRDDATATLARLDALAAAPGERELVRGRHAARANDRDGALSWFRKAAEAAPERSEAWTALFSIGLWVGDAKLVASVLDDPRASAASEPLRFLAGERASVDAAMNDERLRGLVLSALDDRPNRAVLLQAARKVASSGKDAAGREEAARSLRTFADAHQDVLPILVLSAELCAAAGDLNEACEVERIACRNFPSSVVVARRLAELLAAAAQWDAAVAASLQWRERAKGGDAAADLFAMRAMLMAGRAADVVSTFEARAKVAMTRPDVDAPLLILYAVALLRSGRADRTKEVLAAVAQRAEHGRVLPLEASSKFLGDAKSATAWLSACAVNVPADDATAQIALARAYASAWQTCGAPELYQRATSTVAAVLAAPDAPAAAHFLGASLAHQKGDLAAARRGYAAAVARDPKLLDAKNNLAMLLADAGEWEQAVALATELENAAPKNAEYLDTLAYALRKGRQFARAKERLDRAVELDPANPAWKLSLAECLAENGDAAAAASVVASLNAASARGVVMPVGAKERIEKLRIPAR
jgi:tetratricopeptide (TPR) repeat protein